MKKPEPEIGLVIRYDFLWSHERDKDFDEGAKERPCVIVTAIIRKDSGMTKCWSHRSPILRRGPE